ncbi:MAG TPA: ROK family protein [Terracidiphilus sp.]|jgi:glucokinase|nr:ROK family protein [Terracidiphilus sp.]
MKCLSIDLGGTHATCGLVEDDRIIASEKLNIENAVNLAEILPRLAESLKGLAGGKISMQDVAGIAVGIPVIVDFYRGKALGSNGKYVDADRLDLQSWSREALGLPLYLENDARMALIGEAYAGAGRGFENIVMITLGTGIGGVAMIEGKLLRGKHAQAGCIGGHLPVKVDGRKCTCGALGCAEAEASGWSLPILASEWEGIQDSRLTQYQNIGFRELFAEAVSGDRIACEIRDHCLRVWATVTVGLVHAYDPEIVILGGGVMKSADVILPYIEAYVQKYAWTPWGKVKVRAAELGDEAALLGAIPMMAQGIQQH